MIVLDSSFLIAAHNPRDVHHAKTLPYWESLLSGTWGRGILLEHVFIEIVSVLKRKHSTAVALNAGVQLMRAREIDFLPCSEIFLSIWNEFQSDFLTTLSFVDTSIALVAKQRAGGKILSFDKAFRNTPGLKVLPE